MEWIDFCRHWDTMRILSEKLSYSQQYVYHGFVVQGGAEVLIHKDTYSECFRQIILSSAAEFSVMTKDLCKNGGKKRRDIVDISRGILELFPKIVNIELLTPYMSTKPLFHWQVDEEKEEVNGLDWWFAHNKLKHADQNEFANATLNNAIKALGSLYSIDLYVLQGIMGNLAYAKDFPSNYFKFQSYTIGGVLCNANLPDF